MDEKFQEFYKWWKSFKIDLVDFHTDPMLEGMKPVNPKKEIPDGVYFTVRCGLGGIYTDLNEMKDGLWQCQILDASHVIAYRPLTNEEQLQYDYFTNKNNKNNG